MRLRRVPPALPALPLAKRAKRSDGADSAKRAFPPSVEPAAHGSAAKLQRTGEPTAPCCEGGGRPSLAPPVAKLADAATPLTIVIGDEHVLDTHTVVYERGIALCIKCCGVAPSAPRRLVAPCGGRPVPHTKYIRESLGKTSSG